MPRIIRSAVPKRPRHESVAVYAAAHKIHLADFQNVEHVVKEHADHVKVNEDIERAGRERAATKIEAAVRWCTSSSTRSRASSRARRRAERPPSSPHVPRRRASNYPPSIIPTSAASLRLRTDC